MHFGVIKLKNIRKNNDKLGYYIFIIFLIYGLMEQNALSIVYNSLWLISKEKGGKRKLINEK